MRLSSCLTLLSTLAVGSAFSTGLRSAPFLTGSPIAPSFSRSCARSSSNSALSMKTIAVVGASGLLASECVYQALKNGDSVVALTRNPSNLKIPQGSGGAEAGNTLTDPNLTLIGGSVTNPSDVAKMFEGQVDGVVVALGGKTSDVGDTMLTDGTTNVINAMKENNVKRLSVVTSIGAGDSKDQAPFFLQNPHDDCNEENLRR
mmetsp:Transcript_24403/g.35678  ORF Transcript_24403/g.35678 Transcript_24403/m.35678 type:complete len:203 (+) Transcript_24403:69-677(+)